MESKRLRLRVITEKDAQFLLKLMNIEKWHQFIGDRKITDQERARSYINSKMDPELGNKGFINHVMIEKGTNTIVGTCSLHDREGVEGLDIGYALLTEYEGYGYATEGAWLMSRMAFEKFKQPKISAITKDENTASCKVLEKLGFQHRSHVKLPGGSEELKLYVLQKKRFLGKYRILPS